MPVIINNSYVPPTAPQPALITLTEGDFEFALDVTKNRHGVYKKQPGPRGGMLDLYRNDLVGSIAEVAVCRFYGVDPEDQPERWWNRPGHNPDLVINGYTICVKGTERWEPPLRLFFPVNDTSYAAILVSVNVEDLVCGLRGWIRWYETYKYEPVYEYDRLVRHIPYEDMHPCHRS